MGSGFGLACGHTSPVAAITLNTDHQKDCAVL
jgi:hypothetical protein